MDCINGLFQLAQDNFALTFILGFLLAFSETFLSPLPLIAIVITNSLLLGFIPGLIASTLGSVLASIILFIICRKFGNSKLMKKIYNTKANKIIDWVREQGFVTMIICYSCPFIPGFFVTIASGLSKKTFNNFIPGLLCGRAIMFTVASYIGNDIQGFITSPFEIFVVLLIIIVSFLLGKNLSKLWEVLSKKNTQ
ncbi:MAG: TVP38/TMEM64 family protein [Clostridium sp.]